MRVADAECINAKSAKLRLVAAMAELEPGALIGKRMSRVVWSASTRELRSLLARKAEL